MKRGIASIKDEVISLLPNQPSTQDEYFHEEIIVTLLSCLFHHRVKL
jgi:hypothetical protein